MECIGCKEEYTLVKTKYNKNECIYIPQFYSIFLRFNYFHDNKLNPFEKWWEGNTLRNGDYFYNKYKFFYPCKEAINIGTDDNPLYSCIKCHEELEYFGVRWKKYIKITEEISHLSYCISFSEKKIKNCSNGFVLNSATGCCIEKSDVVPAVTWKDIF